MSLCGIGYLENRLDLIEQALAQGALPGQVLLSKLPRDKEKNLRPESVPAFVNAILAGTDPEAALLLALEADTALLVKVADHFWRLGNQAEDLRVSYQNAVADLCQAICEQDIHLIGAGRSALDSPATSLDTSGTVKGHLANIRFLISNLWAARKWWNGNERLIRKYKRALGMVSLAFPDAVQEGRVLALRTEDPQAGEDTV